MLNTSSDYRKYIYVGMALIAMGAVFSKPVIITVGAIFILVGMRFKSQQTEES